jgi:lambda family phage portal protein
VPWAAPVLNTVKMMDGYYEAAVVAARQAAAAPAAIETPLPENGVPVDPNAGQSDQPLEMEPGMMLRLQPGQVLSSVNPNHPTATFEPFTRQLLHAIAAGVGISYGTFTGDLSMANYSSMRVGMLAERDHWRRLQRFLIDHLFARIYREWLGMALLKGMVPGLADTDAGRWGLVEWQPRGFPWIDPLKDFQGDMLEVAAGVSTLTRVAAERGLDLETVLQERKREIEMLDRYGVPSTLATTITDRPQPGNPGGADSTDNTDTPSPGKALPLALVSGGRT